MKRMHYETVVIGYERNSLGVRIVKYPPNMVESGVDGDGEATYDANLQKALDLGAAAFVTHDRDFSHVAGITVLMGDEVIGNAT